MKDLKGGLCEKMKLSISKEERPRRLQGLRSGQLKVNAWVGVEWNGGEGHKG